MQKHMCFYICTGYLGLYYSRAEQMHKWRKLHKAVSFNYFFITFMEDFAELILNCYLQFCKYV